MGLGGTWRDGGWAGAAAAMGLTKVCFIRSRARWVVCTRGAAAPRRLVHHPSCKLAAGRTWSESRLAWGLLASGCIWWRMQPLDCGEGGGPSGQYFTPDGLYRVDGTEMG